MATQYEVEHNIKPATTPRRRRQIDMSTFTAHLSTISPETTTSSTSPSTSSHWNSPFTHNNPHAVPNPTDTSALFRLLQDQMGTLASTAPTESNRAFLTSLVEALELDVAHPPREIEGVTQEFVDGLDRVSRKMLKEDDTCPICAERYLDDQYCLVVELPCHESHRFDLECVAPWLRGKGTCPLCRKEMGKKKGEKGKEEGKGGDGVGEEEEEEDMDGLYA